MKFANLGGEEQQLFRMRLAAIGGVAALAMFALLFRIWFLQVVDGDYYQEVARGNRIRVIPQEAPRGMIYDRNGSILAFNRPAFNVQLILEDTPDLDATLRNLSIVTGYPHRDLLENVQSNRTPLKFKPLLVLEDIGRKSADLVETYQADLPGITVAVEPKRLYPTAYVTSHVIGYVGEISKRQLRKLPLNKVRSGRIVGQAGIELIENDRLIGTDGGKQVEVDHVGRELRILGNPVDPVPGSKTYLTIDLRLQQFIKSLMTGLNGVVLVMRTRTGEMLGMSSYPDFDPNLFVGRIDEATWQAMTQGDQKVLINKAVQGIYPPGSTFKMLIAAAGLDLGIIDAESIYNCPGYHRVGRDIRYCWRRGGHGDLTVVQAIAQSCNVFFYQLGLEVGIDRLWEYGRIFGFGRITGIELESEKTGILPSREWKHRALRERWYHGETMHMAIGQGFLSVTPLQLLNYVNTIANRGLWVRPTVLRRIVSPEGAVLMSEDGLPRFTELLPVSVEALDLIRQGMFDAVNTQQGTAKRARSNVVDIAGKTGTSQVVGRRRGQALSQEDREEALRPHSLFAAFAPRDDPEISVMVLVEHGRSGGETAAPIAKRIIEYYFQEIEPRAPDSEALSLAAPAEPHPFAAQLAGAFVGAPAAGAGSSPR